MGCRLYKIEPWRPVVGPELPNTVTLGPAHLAPPRHRPIHTQPSCTYNLSLTCSYTVWSCVHGVLSLQDWSNSGLSLDLALSNAQHTGMEWGAFGAGPVPTAPCPTPGRAPSRLSLASGSTQHQLIILLNTFSVHAGGVASDATGVRGQDLLGVMGSLPNCQCQCQHKTHPDPLAGNAKHPRSLLVPGVPQHHFQICPLCVLRAKLGQGTFLDGLESDSGEALASGPQPLGAYRSKVLRVPYPTFTGGALAALTGQCRQPRLWPGPTRRCHPCVHST
jgi:hypothetical protein